MARSTKSRAEEQFFATQKKLKRVLNEKEQAQLEKIRATAQANDPQSAARRAALVETENARQIRLAERKIEKRIEAAQRAAQRAAEQVRQTSAAAEEKARKDAERIAKAEAEAALKKEQKAIRDAKYNARKARQK